MRRVALRKYCSSSSEATDVVVIVNPCWVTTADSFFIYLIQQFITRGSDAVRGPLKDTNGVHYNYRKTPLETILVPFLWRTH
jgi:hypothetical protein